MAFIQGDNRYCPRSRAEKRQQAELKSRAKQQRQTREEFAKQHQQSTFKPKYNVPVRNSHLKISSGPKATPHQQHSIEYTDEMIERERISREQATQRTIAPAYNKGPYMVIPESEIQHIGKK